MQPCIACLKLSYKLIKLSTRISFADSSEGCTRISRVIRAIQEYINECDRRFSAERQILPIYRSGRGRQCSIIVRFNFQTGQRQVDDIELFSHSNETLHSLRSSIQRRLVLLVNF